MRAPALGHGFDTPHPGLARRLRAIASQSLRLSAKLGIEVAARQLKERIGRVLFNERAEDGERFFILLIVTMEIQRKIEAREVDVRTPCAMACSSRRTPSCFDRRGCPRKKRKILAIALRVST